MMSKKTVLVGKMLSFGECSANGHIYSKEVMKESIAKFQEKIKNGTAVGYLERTPTTDLNIDLQNISHKITHLKLGDKNLQVELELLDTPKGRTAKAIAEAGLPLYAVISGFGNTDADGNVTNFNYISTIDIVGTPTFKNIAPLQLRTEYETSI